MNATFVTLARNSDIWDIARSIRQVEDRFNRRYNYDWVFLNDKPFDSTFKKVTSSLVSGKTHYGEIPQEHWSFPAHIDQEKAKKVREDMRERKIIYGDSVSYRHMCRFESGFFFRQPLMMNYDYYWRVEPSVELFCDVHYDPFRLMHEQGKKYSFVLSLYEYVETIPTLWDSVKKFMKNHPEHIAKDNSMGFLSDDGGESYNHCHFVSIIFSIPGPYQLLIIPQWSNFEIGNLNWLRSQAYIDFFEALDEDGGFFYERWGDAPVHSIAAGLMLKKDEIHFFNDIAYYHVPFTHCPTGEALRTQLHCHCNPKDNFDWKGYSCRSFVLQSSHRAIADTRDRHFKIFRDQWLGQARRMGKPVRLENSKTGCPRVCFYSKLLQFCAHLQALFFMHYGQVNYKRYGRRLGNSHGGSDWVIRERSSSRHATCNAI